MVKSKKPKAKRKPKVEYLLKITSYDTFVPTKKGPVPSDQKIPYKDVHLIRREGPVDSGLMYTSAPPALVESLRLFAKIHGLNVVLVRKPAMLHKFPPAEKPAGKKSKKGGFGL